MILDPNTGLDVDLPWQASLLSDVLSFGPVRQALMLRGRCTQEGIDRNRLLLSTWGARLGQGQTKDWWRHFTLHVRAQLLEVLTDKIVLRNVALQLAWARGAKYKPVLKELRALRTDLAWQAEEQKHRRQTGLILQRA